LGDAIKIFLFVFFYAIVLQAILSWMQPYSDVNRLLALFTSPIMRPLHRVIPTVGGFDITPIPALILLQLLIMLCADPLMSTGMRLSLG
jgi:YggT family protein